VALTSEIGERRKALIFVATVLAALVILAIAVEALHRTPSRSPALLNHRLSIVANDWRVDYSSMSSNATVFSLLREASTALGVGLVWRNYSWPWDAVFVEEIAGRRNGVDDMWWQYWVNGKYGDVAADQKALSDDDFVLWWYTSYPPPEVLP